MSKWELTEESFNLFLSWLDPDRDLAAKKYEAIQHRLIFMFDSRGCTRSEELTDETINRFIRRLPEMLDSYSGDPAPYLRTIAHHLYIEYLENQPLPLMTDIMDAWLAEQNDEDTERLHQCLDKCLLKCAPSERELVLDYYRMDKQAKIDFRKELAESLGLTVNALRIRIHHIRVRLHLCLDECMEQSQPEM